MSNLASNLKKPFIETDFLIIGGGIIGACIAQQIKFKYPNSKIVVIEKEKNFAQHASGRNSGVLHAGFYYTANSLKARFTKAGNSFWKEYCQRKSLSLRNCGKLIVAQNDHDLPQIDELLTRAKTNQIDLQEISLSDAKKIEPRVKSYRRILWSPSTSTVNPVQILQELVNDLCAVGVMFQKETCYLGQQKNIVYTNRGPIKAGYVVNAAGLYADRIAKTFGFSQHHKTVPFKGLYLYMNDSFGTLNTHIYPVPNLKNPFLGVHYTVTFDGHIKIGPTAIPAFWLEQYKGFDNFRWNEFFQILGLEMNLLLHSDFDFKNLAFQEFRKYSKKYLISLAQNMVEGVDVSKFDTWGDPGIRAQLVDTRTMKLEMDFIYEGDSKSFHVLNAVSPAFTSAMPFAEFLVEKIAELVS